MENPLTPFGRVLIAAGLLLFIAGVLIEISGRVGLPLGRLPGDLALRGKHFFVYVPIVTCLLISVVLSLLMWLINSIRR